MLILAFSLRVLTVVLPSVPGTRISPVCALEFDSQRGQRMLVFRHWRNPLPQDTRNLIERWFDEVWNQNKESTIDELMS
jgi:hypothetical protein